jgi:hypothetical protein
MDDKKILAAACKAVDAKVEQVMSYRVYEDHIALVVDRGGDGCPKYTVPLSELAEPEPAPKEEKSKRKTTRKKSGGKS